MADLTARISQLESEALGAIQKAGSLNQLIEVENVYLSKKGQLSEILKGLKDASPADRPKIGARANEAKKALEEAVAKGRERFEGEILKEKLASERVDVTLPSRKGPQGSLHPITKTFHDVVNVFRRLGFELADGPEVETEFNNFDALNIKPDHPARDMQDTFFLPTGGILRSHTSPVQVRTMLAKKKPPVRILCPGAVFRSDYDMTHSPMFHQLEGLYVDSKVSFAELKGCLLFFAREIFGAETKLRLRPSYFPFVEPGAEIDVSCSVCNGGKRRPPEGCRTCKDTGWLEILGGGMVHPNVFRAVSYDPEATQGFAFGMGIERIAMLRYGIGDLRSFFENDVRFLKQFGV